MPLPSAGHFWVLHCTMWITGGFEGTPSVLEKNGGQIFLNA